MLDEVEGVARYRISSVEPNLFTEGLHNAVLRSEKFCNHFHIPLQSGSDDLLSLMRRRYKRERFASVVDRIVSADPGAGIGADVIVGFPGETADRFAETYRFIEDLPLTYLHVFTYSERENTPAASFADRVEPGLRYQRSNELRALGMKKKDAKLRSMTGRTADVLFESAGDGLTTDYVRVSVGDAGEVPPGSIRPVTIGAVDGDRCTGTFAHVSREEAFA
jgi:threonylcarbamoyladenosine tRNA methylthiotransferase MtaB